MNLTQPPDQQDKANRYQVEDVLVQPGHPSGGLLVKHISTNHQNLVL
eukprot:CAMPEP_0197298618 /NCGR_PEP_ID=MMETSP0890-20130614/43972_1 /TAXON_ID=44058 ORGANISM="Aureoumbra lagunensis, Strain CCMP1510" /NCGR_SAMPLE_ID=MMETSP0890 /ASSEMBLY_ACC=CAM_ASM_000533 /LENGTH=46 /DNA_ID= /DNA_START= /DNA_END= /DNA_ORIENTATION=